MIKESPNSSEKHNRLTIKKGELIMFPTHFDIGQRNLEKEGPLTFVPILDRDSTKKANQISF